MGDVRDTIWVFLEEGNGWVWERRDLRGELILRSQRSWPDESGARSAALVESYEGGRVRMERPHQALHFHHS